MHKRADDSTTLTALVRIPKKGSASVEFAPDDNITADRLIKITILYFAKLCYVLTDDDHGVKQLFNGLLEDLVGEGTDPKRILNRSEQTLNAIEDGMGDSPRAALEVADYRIRLIEGYRTFVNNDIPVFPRDLLGNVPISGILLLNAAARRLSPDDQTNLGRALQIFVDKVVVSSDMSGLFALNQAGLDAIAATKS